MGGRHAGRAHGPWVDLHAHPGRFFLEGLPLPDRAGPFGGAPDADRVQAEAEAAGMAAISYATVADHPVLQWQGPGVLGTARDLAEGEAYADHLRQLAAARSVVSRRGLVVLRSADDIEHAHAAGRTCAFLTCEGADFAEEDLGRVAEAHEAGVRSITLVHYRQNAFGDSQTSAAVHGGLSTLGRDLVREANRAGVLLDLAHASFETTTAVLEESAQPIMISHTHLAGGRRGHPRLIDAAHAVAVADADGLIGAWPSGFSSETFEDFVQEIVRLVEVVGVAHVGIGTDMDANYKPVLTSYDQFAALNTALAERGVTDADIDQILGGNAVRLIRQVCG